MPQRLGSGTCVTSEPMSLSDGVQKFKFITKSTRPLGPESFDYAGSDESSPLLESLEELHIPSMSTTDTAALAKDLARYQGLRVLGVSGIGFSGKISSITHSVQMDGALTNQRRGHLHRP